MTESTESIEERLRAHFAAEAQTRTPADGDDVDVALEHIHSGARGRRVRRNLRRTALAVTAAAATIAAFVVVRHDDDTSVDTITEPSTTVAPTTTAPAVTSTTDVTTTTTAAPPGAGVDQAFVAYEFGVLGAWEGGAWRPSAEADAPTLDGRDFSMIRLDEPITSAAAALMVSCGPSGEGFNIELPWPESSDRLEPSAVAVSGVPDPRPRPVTVLDPASPGYRDAAAPVLEQIGVADDDPHIVQLVRADVEGDGVDEVFGVVERLSDPETLFAEPGDYSAAFLRRVLPDETVETVVLASSVATDDPEATPFVEIYRVSALVDANGDGQMELALWSRYYEGDGMGLYDVSGSTEPPRLLQAGCGV